MMRLDPESPPQVIADLFDTCDVGRIIAQPHYVDQARTIHADEPLVVPQERPLRSKIEPFARTDSKPEHWVAIQTTSGSTGRPKCVPVSRAGMESRMYRKTQYEPPVEPRRRLAFFIHLRVFHELLALQNADIIDCFDLRKHGIAAAVDFMRSRPMTAFTGQVSLLRQILNAAKAPFPDITYIAVVGEAVLRSDLENFEKYFLPGTKFVARFGGTEHCDLALSFHNHGDPINHDVMPLGRPLFPGEMTLVTEDGSIAAPGEPGEIIVTADFLPSGYIKDPERTAAAFFTGPETGQRCYRTGFIAYEDFDGVLHPYGRKDELVKIRGYNVRPSEVEHTVQTHPGVRQAAVRSYLGPKGNQQLACFFVPAGDQPPSAPELRAFLASQAPSYFVPSAFHPLDALPMSSGGKVVRAQLPDPLSLQSSTASPGQEFGSETERKIADIWFANLGHRDFGPDDDFFDVGGDSFQAMAMLVEIEERTGLRLPLESLILEAATVQALAARLDALQSGGAQSSAVVLRHGDDRSSLFATHVIGGHLSDYLELANTLGGMQALIGLHPKGLDGASQASSSMAELAADAIAAMRSHKPESPYRLIGYSYGALIAFEMAVQLQAQGVGVSHLILLDPPSIQGDLARFAKSVYRPLKTGDLSKSARRLTQTVPAALGLRHAPENIDGAHRAAALAYKPEPISIPNTLVVSALKNPHAAALRKEWSGRLMGAARFEEIDATHENLVRQPAVWRLNQIMQSHLAKGIAEVKSS